MSFATTTFSWILIAIGYDHRNIYFANTIKEIKWSNLRGRRANLELKFMKKLEESYCQIYIMILAFVFDSFKLLCISNRHVWNISVIMIQGENTRKWILIFNFCENYFNYICRKKEMYCYLPFWTLRKHRHMKTTSTYAWNSDELFYNIRFKHSRTRASILIITQSSKVVLLKHQ